MVSEDSVRGHLEVCFGLTIMRQGLMAVGVGVEHFIPIMAAQNTC